MYFVQLLWDDGRLASEEKVTTTALALAAVFHIQKDPNTEATRIRVIDGDGDVVFRERSLKGLTFGLHRWPLDEKGLFCPRCNSRNWTNTGRHPVRGTGPGGRGRMGDPGGVDIVRCEDCMFETTKLT